MSPVLKYRAFTLQLVDMARSESGQSIPEGMFMCARHDAEGIQLHIAQVPNRSPGSIGASAKLIASEQRLVDQGKSASIARAEFDWVHDYRKMSIRSDWSE